jgi:YggT family protein
MSENRNTENVSEDLRTRSTITEQPGYASSEQVSQDMGAERRQRSVMVNSIVMTVLGILEILLGLRFVLKLIAANPDSGFSVFIYGITKLFVAPFAFLVGTPTAGGSVVEITTLLAMGIYALFFWIVLRIIVIIATGRPSARTVTRSLREQIPTAPVIRTDTTNVR